MSWLEVKYETSSEAVEAVSSIFIEFGASGVAIEDSQDLVNYENLGFGSYIDKQNLDFIQDGAYVIAYFNEDTDLDNLIPKIQDKVTQLSNYNLSLGKNNWFYREVDEDDWATSWKKYYTPVHISRFLKIIPNWLDYQKEFSDEKIVKLDPGMAFGTGDHPTTRLSLQALETVISGNETILDVGTGSGVLSIACKALGAGSVYAYDVDDVAVKQTLENISYNDYASDILVDKNDLLKGIDIQADIIVANILADIIILLFDDAYKLCKDKGYFIISGIIDEKVPMIQEAAKKVGFDCYQHLKQKDWNAFIYQKN